MKLANGNEFEIDEIILCTGYYVDFSFLDAKILEILKYNPKNKRYPVQLEQNSVYNKKLQNIAFVGVTPFDILPFAQELQSKVAINYFKGVSPKRIRKDEEWDQQDPANYIQGLAEELGIMPYMEKIKEE